MKKDRAPLPLYTPSGLTRVYHQTQSGNRDLHYAENGPWFFEPIDYDGGEVFSSGYLTEKGAFEAAIRWEKQAATEGALNQEDSDE